MGSGKTLQSSNVIVQVRFSPILSLQTYLPEIQEHFRRDGFPAFARSCLKFQLGLTMVQSNNVESVPPRVPIEPFPGYVFSNRDGSQALSLNRMDLRST